MHKQRTYHFEGNEEKLNEIAMKILGVSTSEIKVSMVIDEKYAELAVRGLHDAYELDK
ncbi:MAG: DUF6786 family protein [Campylobacterota bacterium]